MKKYYIEIVIDEEPSLFILQSKWFDTQEQALEWASQIEYLDRYNILYLMSSVWNEEDDTYTDIIQEKELFIWKELTH